MSGKRQLWVTGILSLALASCEKNTSNNTNEQPTDSTQSGQIALDTNPLAESYPDGLAVTAFSATDDTTATVAAGNLALDYGDAALQLTGRDEESSQQSLLLQQPTPPTNQQPKNQCYDSYQEALAAFEARAPFKPSARKPLNAESTAAKDRINGKTDSCVSEEFKASVATVREAIKETGQNLDGYGDCFLPDWGIVEGYYPDGDSDSTNNDVCLVGYSRAQLAKLGAYVDFTKGLSEIMLCQALKSGVVNKEEKEFAEGRSLDLTPQLNDSLKPLPDAPGIASAKISRLAGGRRFVTEYSVKQRASYGLQEVEVPLTIVVDHTPVDSSNTSYSGVIRISYSGRSRQSDGTIALSLKYSRSPDSNGNRVKYELRSGFFGTKPSPFDAEGLVDFNAEGKDQSDNKKLKTMNYVSYDGYPELNIGKLSYWANFGAGYNEAARGMVFDIRRQDGTIKGCGIAGSAGDVQNGISIRSSLDLGYALQPQSYMRPFFCDESLRGGEKLWLQCFYRNAAGVYVPDESLIDDVETGYDFLTSSEVKERVPALGDVPRGPGYAAEKQQCANQNLCRKPGTGGSGQPQPGGGGQPQPGGGGQPQPGGGGQPQPGGGGQPPLGGGW